MSQDRSLRSMDSTMNVLGSTVHLTFGSTAQIYSITCPLRPSSTIKYSACMGDSLQILPILMISKPSTVVSKYQIQERCVTWCGLTLTRSKVGQCLREVQAICLDRAVCSNSTEATTSVWFVERINLSCKVTKRCSPKNWWQSGLLPITAIVVGMWLRFSRSTSTERSTIRYSRRQRKVQK